MGEEKKMSKIFIAVVVIGVLGILLHGVDKTACASGTATTSSSLNPVGRIIYYGYGLTTINADGTEKKRLEIDGAYPSWSPDGNKFAYVKDSDIYVATSDGKTVNKLVDNGNYTDWSPDGSKIAFSRNGEVWTIEPDGTGETRVITKVTDPCQDGGLSSATNPAWSPDGSRFVVLGSGCDGSGLYIVDADGTGATLLAITPTTDYYGNSIPTISFGGYVPNPKWSPDGTMITFFGREYQGEGRQGIWTVNVEGGSAQYIGNNASSPAWSPDGTEIAGITSAGLTAFKADGSGNRVIIYEGVSSGGLDWESGYDDPGDEKGTIWGWVKDKLGVDTIARGTVSLYRQNSNLRSKRSSETEAEYNAYVKSKITLVQQTSISEDGTFKFYNVPYKKSFDIVGSRNWHTANYTIEVTGAEADVDADAHGGNPVLYFAQKAAYNVKVDSENTLELNDLSYIETKRRLITSLSAISENNYKGAEAPLSTYLTNVESGKVEQTDAVIEGIRRGILAERTANVGASENAEAEKEGPKGGIKGLLKIILKGLATLIAEMWKDIPFGEADRIKNAKEWKEAIDKRGKWVEKKWGKDAADKELKRLFSPEQMSAAAAGHTAEMAEAGSAIVKTAFRELSLALEKAGMSEGVKDLSEILQQTALFILGMIQTESYGGTKEGVAFLINKVTEDYIIPVALPRLFDGGWPSYARLTVPYLEYSANKMQGWGKADTVAYKTDSAKVANNLKGFDNALCRVLQWEHFYEAGFEFFDGASDLLGTGIIGKVGVLAKHVKMTEKVAMGGKYLSNLLIIGDPLVFVYWTAPSYVKEGVYAAYGEKPPSSGSFTSKAVTASSVIPIHATAKNERVFKAVDSTASQLKDTLNSLANTLKADKIGEAVTIAAGDDTGNYQDALSAYKQAVSVFLAQALGVNLDTTGTGDTLKNVVNGNIQYKNLAVELELRLMELYGKACTGEYGGPNDPLYIAERNKCVSVINFLISKVDQLSEDMDSFTDSAKDLEFLPAVALKTMLSSSDGSGKGIITKSSDEFTLRVQVRNVSTVSVSGLFAELTVTSPKDSVKVSPDTKLTVGNGTLAADDGVDGSGSDEASVEWTIKYEGDLSEETILMEVNILENDETPSSFVTLNAQRTLSVDPTLFDKDLDFMDDEWEASYGLNTEKDDSQEDMDGDGLTNEREYDLGTTPNVADTDGDGISDGDEVNGTKTGFDTDPLKEDTDDDGASDDSDGQPLDDGTTEKDESAGEPEVAVDQVTVTLTESEPTASVSVTNSGTSTLYWSAQSENDAIAVTNPSQKNTKIGSLLTISAPSWYDFKHTGTNTTKVTVIDVWGAVKDYKEISVTVQPGAGFTEKPTASPVITDFKPQKGKPGTIVRIMGENFSPKKSRNIVAFAGTEAKVVSANKKGTEIKAKVPKQAQTGYITVTVDGNTAESKEQFTVTKSK